MTARAFLSTAALSLAATTAWAQAPIPVRRTAPPTATTKEPLGLILSIKHLSDGRVLVDDAGTLRLVMFDATFANATIIADTTGKAPLAYGPNPTPLISYLGDSSLFLDRRTQSFQLLDGQGKAVRTVAMPKASDTPYIWGGRVLVDAAGRLYYRGGIRTSRIADTGQAVLAHFPGDSAPLVRADFDRRTIDTLGAVKLPRTQEDRRTRKGDGTFATTIVLFGHTWLDDWVVTSDGSIAIARGQDYHIDWIAPNGAKSSSPKMPFDWLRLPDEEKLRLADSAAREVTEFYNGRVAQQQASGRANNLGIVARADLATGMMQVIPLNAKLEAAPLNLIPDYKAPMRAGALKADREGNVWILAATSAQSRSGGIVYDVVNRRGEVFERVEMPADRSVVDFGPGGIVYLMFKDAAGAWHLERSRVIR